MTDLFPAHTRARTDDPATSHAAAARIVGTLREKQARVFTLLKVHREGLTNWEIEDFLGDHGATWRTRTSELVRLGLVTDSGRTRIITKSKSNHQRVVWICTAFQVDDLLSKLG